MKILSPLNIGDFSVDNRIVMPPMCLYKADNDGKVKEFHKIHYAARAIGKVSMIIVEACAVEPRGRISDNDLGLWDDAQIKGCKELVDICHEFGSKIGIQLAHAGRKSGCKDLEPVAPSKSRFSNNLKEAKELSENEIKETIKKFIDAAKRAKDAGFDFVEIHAAHGYLINEFLSPLTNFRKDEFGGDFFARTKFLFEIAKGIKNENITFGVRLSASEWEEGGIDIEDMKMVSSWLEVLGASYIHVSAGGNHENPSLAPKITPLYQCKYSKEIKKILKIPVIAVGEILTPQEGEALLLGDVCDLVAFGKELLRNPNLALFAARDFKRYDLVTKPYLRAFFSD